MRSARSWVALGAAGLAMSATVVAMGLPTATAATSRIARTSAGRSVPPRSVPGPLEGRGHEPHQFDADAQAAPRGRRARIRAQGVKPGSDAFHHYLTDAQWEHRYSPSPAQVARLGHGCAPRIHRRLGPPYPDVHPARGTAAQVEKAFSTGLGLYKVNGHTVRLTTQALSIPTTIAGSVAGVVGINQYINTTPLTRGAAKLTHAVATKGAEPAPPAGFRNPQPCSAVVGSEGRHDGPPSLYAPYTGNAYDICGYTPTQLRGATGSRARSTRATTGAVSRSRSWTPTTPRRCCRTRSGTPR